jgi:hypothetical protein
MKLKPLLLIAGGAAGVAAVVKRRSAAPDEQPHARYAPPAEALAQQPSEPGGSPTAETRLHETPVVAEDLNVPEHGPPAGSVTPDTSADDPLVRRQEDAAAADADAIAGTAEQTAMRPVFEGSGDDEETFEKREDVDRGDREVEP